MIYVMRHAESVVNIERRFTCHTLEGPLTPKGRQQATQAAGWLKDKNITAIYTSPFERAKETAQIICKALKIDPVLDDRLREVNCGSFEGRTGEAAWADWGMIFKRWRQGDRTAKFPGGESFGEGFDRFAGALKLPNPDENTLLVTHGGIVLAVVPYLCVNAAALQRVNGQDNTGFVILEPYDAERYICESWNLVEHLSNHEN